MSGCEEKGGGVEGEFPAGDPGAREMTVVSLNLRYENPKDKGARSWGLRVLDVVEFVRGEAPEIFATQEGLFGQVADLRASLTDYEFAGVGRDDGEKKGEFAGIFYRGDRFAVDDESARTFWLSGTPEVPGSMTFGNGIPRIATYVRLEDRVRGLFFYVVNVHLDHANQRSREKGIQLILDRLEEINPDDEPVILLGDFNAMGANPALALLEGEFEDTFGGQENRGTVHFWREGRHQDWRIDRIYTSAGFEVAGGGVYDANDPPLSDHYPVWAHLVLEGD